MSNSRNTSSPLETCWPVHGTNRLAQKLNLGCTQECRRRDLVYEQCRPIFATMHPPLWHWLWVHSWSVDRGSTNSHRPASTLLGRRQIGNPTVSSSVVERVPMIVSPPHCPHRHEAPRFLDRLNCHRFGRNNRTPGTMCNTQWRRSSKCWRSKCWRSSTIQRCCGPRMWPRCGRGRRSGGGEGGGAAAFTGTATTSNTFREVPSKPPKPHSPLPDVERLFYLEKPTT